MECTITLKIKYKYKEGRNFLNTSRRFYYLEEEKVKHGLSKSFLDANLKYISLQAKYFLLTAEIHNGKSVKKFRYFVKYDNFNLKILSKNCEL